MGWYVHIHVCFACDKNDAVAELARKHLPNIVSDESGVREARWFLEDLSKRSGSNSGTKGGLSLWGMIGNYTRVESFVDALMPFWRDLLSDESDEYYGPRDFERVIVFEEHEQSGAANAYEIYWDDPESSGRSLVVKEHERLPFTWGQL